MGQRDCGTARQPWRAWVMSAAALAALASPLLHAQDALDSIEVTADAEPAAAAAEQRPAATAETTVLDTVVVTGTRTAHRVIDSPVDVQVISARTIAHSGARDVAELLQREGGVYVTPLAGRGTSIEIQGLSSEQVLILVDGRRMIGRIFGGIDLTRLRLDSIERIEIVKGPSSALYGADALGGVVNLISKRDGSGGVLSTRHDTLGDHDVQGTKGWTAGPVTGQLSAGYSDLNDFDIEPGERGRDGSVAQNRNVAGNADWQINESAGIDTYGAYALDDSHRVTGGSGGGLYDVQKRIEEVRSGVAPYFHFGANTDLNLNAYYNRYYDQFLQTQRGNASNIIDEETVNELFSGSGQLDQRIGLHRISVGGEYQFERLSADRLQETGERDRQSVYLQDEVSAFDERLKIVPGIRYDRDSQYGSQWSPKLALRYDISSDWFLRAGYGRGYRAPDFKQLLLRFENPSVGYVVNGNPNLKPERGTGFNLGSTWLFGNSSSLALNAFHNRVRELIDIIQQEPEPGSTEIVYSYRNVDSARLSGLDLQLRTRPWQPLELQLGAGLLDTEDKASGDDLSGRARYRANAAVTFEQADYLLALRGVWIDKRVYTVELDTGGEPTPPGTSPAYTLLDFRAEWTRWQPLTFALGMKNLLDEGEPTYLPIQPRAGYLEIRWNLQ